MKSELNETEEMTLVWDKIQKNEDPTADDLIALRDALKEKLLANEKLDALRKNDDPAYVRPKRYHGLDSVVEAHTLELLAELTYENFDEDRTAVIHQLRLIWYYL